MAYTGTGTQTDPYIIDNWTDFKALCGTSGVYITFDPDAENKVIDINDTEDREGLSANLNLKAHVDGSGWEIRNLYTSTHWIIGGSNTVQNLHFTDLISNGTETFHGPINLTNCRFSIMFLSTACFGDSNSNSTVTNCSFHFRFMNTDASSILFKRYWTLNYCDIRLEGRFEGLSLMTVATREFCRITGHVQLGGGTLQISAGNAKGSHDVTALHVTGTGTVTAQYAGKTLCLVDTDLIEDTLTVTLADNYQGLTTAQMQDSSYLMDMLGFPCIAADA